jgi:hypothetical protein
MVWSIQPLGDGAAEMAVAAGSAFHQTPEYDQVVSHPGNDHADRNYQQYIDWYGPSIAAILAALTYSDRSQLMSMREMINAPDWVSDLAECLALAVALIDETEMPRLTAFALQSWITLSKSAWPRSALTNKVRRRSEPWHTLSG